MARLRAGSKSLPRRLFRALQAPPQDVRRTGTGPRRRTLPPLFRALTKANLLILDDWGPERLTAEQRRDLMEIVEDRYQNAATLITSQLPLATWHEVIGEPTFADAILDRIVHNAHRLELDGPSMRKVKVGKNRPATIDRAQGK